MPWIVRLLVVEESAKIQKKVGDVEKVLEK
jgi:hypothetical protein